MPPDDHSDNVAPDSSPLATLHALEHKVEDAVEEAIHVAERSLARRFGAGCVRGVRLALRALWFALVVAYFAFGALWLATRYYVMPHIDEFRPALERAVSRMLDARVEIARIESDWRGFNPLLRIADVRILDRNGHPALTLPQLEAALSWASVPALQLRLRDLWIMAPEIDVEHLADGRFVVAGFVIDPRAAGDGRFADWVLSQSHIGIRAAQVRYRDAAVEGGAIEFDQVDLEFRGGYLTHRFAFRARPPAALGAVLDLRGEFQRPWFERATDVSQWTGRVFVQTDYADVARGVRFTHLLPEAMSIERAQGAVRAWLDFDRGHIGRFTADLALADVSARLGATLEPLRVERLQGRIESRAWGTIREGGQEFSAQQLTLTGADLALPPTDVRVRLTRAGDDRPARGLVEASGVSLATATALAAQLPLPAQWHQTVRSLGARGDLAELRYTWEGDAAAPAQYALRTRFDRLSLNGAFADPLFAPSGRPRPGRPGFENLSGTLEVDQRGGTAQVRARDAVLDFPGVFAEPLAFGALNANARWSQRDGFELRIDSLYASGPDLELRGQATYHSGGKGIGIIDAGGQIVRAEANRIYRVIPLVVGPATRDWLRAALVAGAARDGSFRLKGDLADFPFAQPGSGEFRIATKIAGGTLDYLPVGADDSSRAAVAPAWPQISGIEGDFVYERRRIEIVAHRAQVFGIQLGPVQAVISDIHAADPKLAIDGKGRGALADVFRFVNASPVGGWLGGILARASGTGTAAFGLTLDIPLHHAHDTRVNGTVALADNDVWLRDDLPPFARVNGSIGFTEKSLRIAGIGGTFVGGAFRADVNTRADGAIEISGSGTLTPQEARPLVGAGPLQRLIDRTQGTARYTTAIVVKNRRVEFRATSDLTGIGVDLPEPLRKAAPEALPVRVEIVPREGAGDGDTIRVAADARLALVLERSRDAAGAARIERAALAVGSGDLAALVLPESGMRAVVTADRLDVDRWLALIDGQAVAGAGPLDAVSARVRELVVGGRPIANVVLGATRDADGIWLANVNSDHVSGAVTWRPSRPGAQARISARLARLTIPEGGRTQLVELLDAAPTELPAFDVVANEFEMGGYKLGRLELQAQNVGAGPGSTWQLRHLELSNPDGRMAATGQWQRTSEGAPRRMSMNLVLDFSDAGNLLGRFGMAGALRGGEGKLEGEIGWLGSPFSIDYPSLSGRLKLATEKGQFLKMDAGVGRLLGVLSLQALPRRITLDFRDVFSEGFAFDSITAGADVAAGVLSTEDFKMRGVNANVLIEGSVDLRRETQNLHVLVLPEINAASASLAYALLANPAVGLGAFLAQWILRDPLSKALSYEFDISGAWSDPQVKRRGDAAATGKK